MSPQSFEAIYENGVLRPLQPLQGVEEHQRLQVTVQQETQKKSILDCVGILPDEDARQMLQAIEEAFEQIDMNEWDDPNASD